MTSSVGWVVLDEDHRKSLAEAISAFHEKDTVDELGVGVVRDAFSNLLFPGTSLLHTRAKYLLFVPWIYDGLRQEGISGRRAVTTGRKREIELIDALLAGSPGQWGVIGREARSQLKTLPSAAYWSALRRYGILAWDVSLTGYCDHIGPSSRPQRRSQDEDGTAPETAGPWHNLPPAEDLTGSASLSLTSEQADYLYDCITATARDSLLLWMLDRGTQDAQTPWDHPQVEELPEDVAVGLDHARWFSHVMHGAALLYNYMLAQKAGLDDLEALYGSYVDEWHDSYGATDRDRHDRVAFWSLVQARIGTVPYPTKSFMDRWIDIADAGGGTRADTKARQLIADRELRLKTGLARLHNARALERWGGASSAGPMLYRWARVRYLIDDIYSGR